jgi:hypothetical protein
MPSLPKRIKILGKYYTIKYLDESGEDLGSCDSSKHEIVLYRQHEDSLKTTLLHEVVEAMDMAMEWDLEHKVITQLETTLFQIIKDNPKLIKYLQEK